jgi:hypothetical protein
MQVNIHAPAAQNFSRPVQNSSKAGQFVLFILFETEAAIIFRKQILAIRLVGSTYNLQA